MTQRAKPPKTINQVAAENIRYYMEQRGEMTQAKLARLAGLSQKSISNYTRPEQRVRGDRGKEPSAKLTELACIADALEVKPHILTREMRSDAEREIYEMLDASIEKLMAHVAMQPPTKTTDAAALEGAKASRPAKKTTQRKAA